MKRINFWALLATGLIGLPVVAFAEDDVKKLESSQSNDLFKKLDKNGDGKLVPDEISEDQGRFFDRLVRLGDKDDNGELTKAEFEAAIKRSDAPVQGGGAAGGRGGFGGGRPMIDFKQMLERLDKNNDGKISKDEIPEEGPARFLREMMARQNKDSITADDFEQIRRRMADGAPGGRPNLNPEDQFKRMDANGDGKVTLDEIPEQFRDRARPLFERAKKDVLSLNDVVAFAQAREGERRAGDGERGEAARKSEGDAARRTEGEGRKKEGEARKPEGEARKPEGEARKPEGEARKPEGEARKPEGEARKKEGGDRPEVRKTEGQPEGVRRREGDSRPSEGSRPPEGVRRGPGVDAPRGVGDRGPGEGQRRGPMPRFFELIDNNHDGRITREELGRLKEVFGELDRNKDGELDPSELFGPPPGQPGPQDGRGPGGARPPEGRGPAGQPPRDGDRRPDGDRPRDGERRPEGDRPRDGERKPEGDRPRDGERKPEGDRPRDGERRPEADRPREGERRPEPRSEGRPARPDQEKETDKPRDKDK